MPRSWAHPHITAYEIKVSRNDFLRDEKWRKYLDLCNSLYFVAPKGVISRDELPQEVGLLEVSANAKRLYTRKKAATREVEIPESIFRYVLMCRATISETERRKEDRFEYWESWLRTKKKGADLGYMVSTRIRETVVRVEDENRQLKRQNEAFADVREILSAAGIEDLTGWYLQDEVENRLKEMREGINRSLRTQLQSTGNAIQHLVEEIDKDLGQ